MTNQPKKKHRDKGAEKRKGWFWSKCTSAKLYHERRSKWKYEE